MQLVQNAHNKSKINPFSLTKIFSEGAHIKNKQMEIKISQEEFTMDTEHIVLEGKT
jgi:UDP-N-acetylmuramoylalanine--D-glutamate ligase